MRTQTVHDLNGAFKPLLPFPAVLARRFVESRTGEQTMKIELDLDNATVSVVGDPARNGIALASAEGFALASKAWLRAGWDAKHVYSFTWLGRPIIQLPEDMIRLQEVIWAVRPDVIVETGVAHGGSLVFYASLFEAMRKGRVIGVDIEIRPHNRAALEAHPLFHRIELVEGSSTSSEVVTKVKSLLRPEDRVLVFLDSKHTKDHVMAELELYSPLVSVGSYVVAMDGIMGEVAGGPRTSPDWTTNNPAQAAREFAAENPRFVIEEPSFAFNEGVVRGWVTYWPDGFLKRVR
jgi:cephalosporin hydroxylase